MSYFLTKTFVALLSLAFMAQTIAAPASCATNDSADETATHQIMMEHTMQPAINMFHQESTDKPDCCDNDCSCPAGVCSSCLVISNPLTHFAGLTEYHNVNHRPELILPPTITSLFRPPIFS